MFLIQKKIVLNKIKENHKIMPRSKKSQANQNVSSSDAYMTDTLNATFERRRQYKDLLVRGARLNERVDNNECSNTLKEVKSLIENSNKISKENNETAEETAGKTLINASENVMDATVMKMGHEILGTVANKLGHIEFAEEVYAAKVLEIVGDGRDRNWNLFGEKILKAMKVPRYTPTMLGTFDATTEPIMKSKKERIMRQKAAATEVKRPEKVSTLKKEEKGVELLSTVMKKIVEEYNRRKAPIHYYELILDPDDFMITIDNAFQVAFLVRDNRIGITLGDDNEPYVYVPTQEEIEVKKRDLKTTQGVVGLNYAKWMETKKMYPHIEEPILKINRGDFVPLSQTQTQMN
uniref:Non-structural maintenance of chromosomes element 4 n=1 Tax=Culicoides sonorensis TaxID=179676 RepID=A0A336LPW4_CULSO